MPRHIIVVFENQARLEGRDFAPDLSSGGGLEGPQSVGMSAFLQLNFNFLQNIFLIISILRRRRGVHRRIQNWPFFIFLFAAMSGAITNVLYADL